MDCTQKLILESERLRLEPLEWTHFDRLLPIALAHPDLLQFSPSVFGSEENLKVYFEDALITREKGIRYPFAIYDKTSESFVGSTSMGFFSPADLRVEIGWTWIDRGVQGSGLNKACKFLLLQYIFEVLQYERLEFRTDGRNIRSQRAMEKIGATFEGELRSHTVLPDGFRRNTRFYSILKSEWPEIRRSIFVEF